MAEAGHAGDNGVDGGVAEGMILARDISKDIVDIAHLTRQKDRSSCNGF